MLTVAASRVIATPTDDRIVLHFVEGAPLAYEVDGTLRTEPDEEVCIVLDRAMVVRTIRELYRVCRPDDAERAFRVVNASGPSDLMTWDDAVTVLLHIEKGAGGREHQIARIAREERDDKGRTWLVDVPRPV